MYLSSSVITPVNFCPSSVSTMPVLTAGVVAASAHKATAVIANALNRQRNNMIVSSGQISWLAIQSSDGKESGKQWQVLPGAASPLPDARQRLVATGATAVAADSVLRDAKTRSANQGRLAMVAPCVLPLAHLAGKIAGIDVLQAGRSAQL